MNNSRKNKRKTKKKKKKHCDEKSLGNVEEKNTAVNKFILIYNQSLGADNLNFHLKFYFSIAFQ